VPVRIVVSVSDDVDDSGPATSEGERGPVALALPRPDRTLIIPAPARRHFLSHGSINLRSAPIGPFASHNSVFPALGLSLLSSCFPLRAITGFWDSPLYIPHLALLPASPACIKGRPQFKLFPQSVEQNCDLLVESDADTVIIVDHGTFFWATLFLC
jgi:hypothetical protein